MPEKLGNIGYIPLNQSSSLPAETTGSLPKDPKDMFTPRGQKAPMLKKTQMAVEPGMGFDPFEGIKRFLSGGQDLTLPENQPGYVPQDAEEGGRSRGGKGKKEKPRVTDASHPNDPIHQYLRKPEETDEEFKERLLDRLDDLNKVISWEGKLMIDSEEWYNLSENKRSKSAQNMRKDKVQRDKLLEQLRHQLAEVASEEPGGIAILEYGLVAQRDRRGRIPQEAYIKDEENKEERIRDIKKRRGFHNQEGYTSSESDSTPQLSKEALKEQKNYQIFYRIGSVDVEEYNQAARKYGFPEIEE